VPGPTHQQILYPLVAALSGYAWLFSTPVFWKERDPWIYAIFPFLSLAVAILLKSRISCAAGWRLWALGAVAPLLGSLLVTAGLSTVVFLRDGMFRFRDESVLERLAKMYLLLPVLGALFTLMWLPLLAPLGALWVAVLRRAARP